MNYFKYASVLLGTVLLFGVTNTSHAAMRDATAVGDNVVLPPTVTSPEDGERVKHDFIKLLGNTGAQYKIAVTVDGQQHKFRGRKYLTANKSGIFEAFMTLAEGHKDDTHDIAVYAINPETGKMSQATEVTVVLDDDMLLTQYHGRVGYCDSDGNFLRAPQSKKMYTYRMALGLTKVLAATSHGGAGVIVPAGAISINNNGEYKANLHKAAITYIGLLGAPYSASKVLDSEDMFEGVIYIDMTEDLGKDLGLYCLSYEE